MAYQKNFVAVTGGVFDRPATIRKLILTGGTSPTVALRENYDGSGSALETFKGVTGKSEDFGILHSQWDKLHVTLSAGATLYVEYE